MSRELCEQTVAREFWTTQESYPSYDYLEERCFCDARFILSHIQGCRSYLDLGCGEGNTALMLLDLCEVTKFYMIDQNPHFLKNLERVWDHCEAQPQLNIQVGDILASGAWTLPATDVTVLFGVLPYIFTSGSVKDLLENIHSNLVLIRTPCAIEQSLLFNNYSEKLQDEYAAYYRSLPETVELISQSLDIQEMVRIWPDNIESAYGTRQYAFVCRRR